MALPRHEAGPRARPRPIRRSALEPHPRGDRSPLSSWFAGDAAAARFRRRRLGRDPIVLTPRDGSWRSVAPGSRATLTLAHAGLPFQIVADRRYDRSGDPRALPQALAEGRTIVFPQIHQVLPRLMRLMVALRATFHGPFREERSFLFLTRGGGREAMGLHHDGPVDAFWLQLAGRRTVTTGPRVAAGTPQDLDLRRARGGPRAGWRTRSLTPGTLFYLPPFTPHRVVCHGPSLALSLTWGRRRGATRPAGIAGPGALARTRAEGAALAAWDVVSGRADRIPRERRSRLWMQVPAVAGPVSPRRGTFPLWAPGEVPIWLPAAARPFAVHLASMPTWLGGRAPEPIRTVEATLVARGLLAPCELPRWVVPARPDALDGWLFA